MRKLIGFPILLFFLSGCYQASLAPMIGPAASVSQGRIAYSAVSTGVSYGVKHKTGKYPIEHILKREKDKIVNKVVSIEKEVIKNSSLVKEKLINQKNNLKIKEKVSKKLRWVLHIKEIKNVKQEEAFPANKPRYSYWSKQK
tara:strand:+ start:356 stop:781 length:426 start_codon:yes stop_codon:yes gene_type:complete